MQDYSGPMHAAAADLMAITGHPTHALHHPSSVLLTNPYETAPVKSESLQGINPPVCYHESLPTQFLPLNVDIAWQPTAQLEGGEPASRLLPQAQTHVESPTVGQGGPSASLPHAAGDPPPDGLPAVERYSKMVANVLQVAPLLLWSLLITQAVLPSCIDISFTACSVRQPA